MYARIIRHTLSFFMSLAALSGTSVGSTKILRGLPSSATKIGSSSDILVSYTVLRIKRILIHKLCGVGEGVAEKRQAVRRATGHVQTRSGSPRALHFRPAPSSSTCTDLFWRYTAMSTATPAASTPDGQSPAATNPPDPSTANLNAADKLVLEYLRSRGHAAAEKLLQESLETTSPGEKTPPGPSSTSSTISPEELASRIAVYAQKPARPGENTLSSSGTVIQELGSISTQQDIQKLISSIGPVGAEEILSLDPTDKQEGFRELEAWVDGSLDMYKVRSTSLVLSTRLTVQPLARVSANIIPNIRSLLFGPYTTRFQGSWCVSKGLFHL